MASAIIALILPQIRLMWVTASFVGQLMRGRGPTLKSSEEQQKEERKEQKERMKELQVRQMQEVEELLLEKEEQLAKQGKPDLNKVCTKCGKLFVYLLPACECVCVCVFPRVCVPMCAFASRGVCVCARYCV